MKEKKQERKEELNLLDMKNRFFHSQPPQLKEMREKDNDAATNKS